MQLFTNLLRHKLFNSCIRRYLLCHVPATEWSQRYLPCAPSLWLRSCLNCSSFKVVFYRSYVYSCSHKPTVIIVMLSGICTIPTLLWLLYCFPDVPNKQKSSLHQFWTNIHAYIISSRSNVTTLLLPGCFRRSNSQCHSPGQINSNHL